jgi:hypothetical protein
VRRFELQDGRDSHGFARSSRCTTAMRKNPLRVFPSPNPFLRNFFVSFALIRHRIDIWDQAHGNFFVSKKRFHNGRKPGYRRACGDIFAQRRHLPNGNGAGSFKACRLFQKTAALRKFRFLAGDRRDHRGSLLLERPQKKGAINTINIDQAGKEDGDETSLVIASLHTVDIISARTGGARPSFL